MSLLTTDLVYGEDAQYLFHYMGQAASAGSIRPGFHSESAMFRPIHKSDVVKAVSHQLGNSNPGHFRLNGNSEHSIKQLLGMVEQAAGKDSTGAQNELVNSFVSMFDDFFTGNTHDGNLDAMMKYYSEAGNECNLPCFWQSSGLSADQSVESFFKSGAIDTSVLSEPPMSAYKSVSLD